VQGRGDIGFVNRWGPFYTHSNVKGTDSLGGLAALAREFTGSTPTSPSGRPSSSTSSTGRWTKAERVAPDGAPTPTSATSGRFVSEGVGSVVQLLSTASYVGTLPRQSARFIEQCYMIGYTTLPIVAILSFFIGTVLALEAGYSMQDFGAKEFIGSLVGLSMARELGPMMTAILLAGRVGSAITAELASMTVYQEIDALTTMNIPPAKMLVLPRLAAVLVMMPVLTSSPTSSAGSAGPWSPATPATSGSLRRPTSPRCATT
jgi:NADH:ubiquinone oxidoreductase subunit 6 (subunit J)